MRMGNQFLLLIHILEALIMNEKVYNRWNVIQILLFIQAAKCYMGLEKEPMNALK